MPTKFGITYEVVDVDNPGTFTFKADGSDTTATAVMTDGTQNITLNFNNTDLNAVSRVCHLARSIVKRSSIPLSDLNFISNL